MNEKLKVKKAELLRSMAIWWFLELHMPSERYD